MTSLSAPTPKKRGQLKPENDLAPVLRGLMNISLGKPLGRAIRILVDSGASHTVIDEKLCRKLRVKKCPHTRYKVPGKGIVLASSKCKVYFELPQLSPTMAIEKELVVLDDLSHKYDLILGMDLILELGLVIDGAE